MVLWRTDVNGHLGVARAFGDFHIEGLKGTEAKPGPLVVEPEVERWRLTHQDEFVIIACDGLWDVFSSHNAVDFARQALRRHNDPEAAAKELCTEALRRIPRITSAPLSPASGRSAA